MLDSAHLLESPSRSGHLLPYRSASGNAAKSSSPAKSGSPVRAMPQNDHGSSSSSLGHLPKVPGLAWSQTPRSSGASLPACLEVEPSVTGLGIAESLLAKELLKVLRADMWKERVCQTRAFQELEEEIRNEVSACRDAIAAVHHQAMETRLAEGTTYSQEMEARFTKEAAQRREIEARLAEQAAKHLELEAQLGEEITQRRGVEARLTKKWTMCFDEEAAVRRAVDSHLEGQIASLRTDILVSLTKDLPVKLDSFQAACQRPWRKADLTAEGEQQNYEEYSRQRETHWHAELAVIEMQRNASTSVALSTMEEPTLVPESPTSAKGALKWQAAERSDGWVDDCTLHSPIQDTACCHFVDVDLSVQGVASESCSLSSNRVHAGLKDHETAATSVSAKLQGQKESGHNHFTELDAAAKSQDQLSRAVSHLESRIKTAQFDLHSTLEHIGVKGSEMFSALLTSNGVKATT